MAIINEIYKVTLNLYNHLQRPISKNNRSDYINRIEELLEQREELITRFNGEVTDSDKKIGNEIVKYNTFINARIENIYKEIGKDLTHIKQNKKTKKKYENPYNLATADSVFFDKKN